MILLSLWPYQHELHNCRVEIRYPSNLRTISEQQLRCTCIYFPIGVSVEGRTSVKLRPTFRHIASVTDSCQDGDWQLIDGRRFWNRQAAFDVRFVLRDVSRKRLFSELVQYPSSQTAARWAQAVSDRGSLGPSGLRQQPNQHMSSNRRDRTARKMTASRSHIVK